MSVRLLSYPVVPVVILPLKPPQQPHAHRAPSRVACDRTKPERSLSGEGAPVDSWLPPGDEAGEAALRLRAPLAPGLACTRGAVV